VIALALAGAGGEVGAQITRVANTTLAFPQSPQSFDYTTEDAFPGLVFDQPLGIVAAPGETNRVFILEKTGRIQVVTGLGATPVKQVFLDLSAKVLTAGEQGLLGVAFHPNFAANRYFYVFYSTNATTSAGGGAHERVSRFTALASPATNADILATEVPLISQYDEASNHNGGDLHFGPDGYLYISVGDEGAGNDSFNNSQRIDKDFFSGLLRIDVDQQPGNLTPNPHPSVHGGTYKVPADNPFVGASSFNGSAVTPSNVRTEFWAVGLRNPWRFSFDAPTGRLFAGDVGQGAREEINLIVRGGNYGWNYREGTIAGPKGGPPAAADFIDPIWDADRSVAGSITGGVVYRGSRFPQLSGQYVFGDYVQNRVFAMTIPASGPVQVAAITPVNSPVAFGVDPGNGDVLIASIGTGIIRRLVYGDASGSANLPATLTATGAFTNLASLAPAPGIVPYEPNVSFWSDYATKRRWFSVPSVADKITFAPEGNWTFPTGTVWVKHFELELTRGNPATSRRLETRFIVKTADGVYGLTYRWNAAQTEASLVPDEGASEVISINDGGVIRSQTWRYPSRAECLQCHTPAGGHALGFDTAQLNRMQMYASGSANQLTALANAGYFTAGIPAPASLRALAPADDISAILEHRARSYLAANCVQCHQPGGTAPGSWDARIETPTAGAGLINGALVDPAGDGANRVIVPGDKAHSMLLARIAKRGSGQMPPVASNEIDPAGVALLTSWINELGSIPSSPAPTITTQPVNQVVTIGHVVTFSAASSDGGAWQVSTNNGTTWSALADNGTYGGAATDTLTISGATAGLNGNRYRFVSSNGGGSTNSNAALLTVSAVLFPYPAGIALDSSGNLYVSDSTANVVQKISASGAVSLLAGANGTAGAADGTGSAAQFNQPGGLVRLASGVVFVADAANSTIRRIGTDGVVTTFAGSSSARGNADGTGTAATFSSPMGIAADASGNLQVADSANHTIRRITPTGVVTTLAGGAGMSGSNDGSASAARFNRPGGVAVDGSGNVYVADTTNNTIRRLSPAGTVTTLAGIAGVSGSTDGTGPGALFNQPAAVAVDTSGNIYVADAGNSCIRKITPAGVVTTLAGLPTVAGLQDGAGSRAWFNQPKALAVDGSGNVFVADTGNASLRKVTPQGTVATLVLTAAGTPGPDPTPVPNPTPTPGTGGGNSGGGGGGSTGWLAGGLGLLVLVRLCRVRDRRTPARSGSRDAELDVE